MKALILRVLKSKLLFAAVLNVVIMAVCIIFTSFSYESSRDFYNSILICREHFYYSSSINYILAVIIGTVQYAFGDFNCFVLFELVLSYFAFTSITFVFTDKFSDKYNYRKGFVFTLVINIIFALNHYSNVDSSKTAALLLTAGFLLLLNAIRNKRYDLPFWIGILEIAFGSFYDFIYFFVALGFAVAFFFGDMIAKKKYRLDFQKLFWYFRPFLLSFLFAALVVLGLNQFSYSVNHATEEASNYYEYSQLNNQIDTLPFPDYEEHVEEFKSAGIDDVSEYELLKNGYYDKDRDLNLDALREVSRIQREDNSKTFIYAVSDTFSDMLDHLLSLDTIFVTLLVFLGTSFVFIIYHKNRFSFFPLFYAVIGLIAGIVLRYLFSGAGYMVYGIWLMMLTLLIFSFNFEIIRKENTAEKFRMKNGFFILSCVGLVALLAGYVTVFLLNQSSSKPQSTPQHLFEEISRNPDCYYVIDASTEDEFIRYTENYQHPLWGFRSGYLDNLDSFRYFHNNETLRKRNLSENIYEAVINHRKIYVIDKYITYKKEDYFNLNYAEDGKSIVFNQLDSLDDYKIYQVVMS